MEYPGDLFYIEKLLEGDTSVFRFLVDRHKAMVFSIVVRICSTREDAEEVAQDVFVKAYQKMGSFRKESKFSTWLYRIAYNESITHVRKKKLNLRSLEDERSEEPVEEEVQAGFLGMDETEQKKLVNKMLVSLPEEERTLVSLFYLHDLAVDEISKITGLGKSNVKVKLHRIRKKIYGNLDQVMNQNISIAT